MIRPRPSPLAAAALLGAATGSRSSFGLAALAMTARSGPLARPAVRFAFVAAAVVEVVADKLPMTPSRLQSRGLIARIGAGAACGALVARRDRRPEAAPVAAAIATLAAVTGAFIGAGWRRLASSRLPDLAAAIAEDLVAAATAGAGSG